MPESDTPRRGAPEGNKFAAKDEAHKKGDSFSLRAPAGMKGRAVKASRARNMGLSDWLIEAIKEKLQREEPRP